MRQRREKDSFGSRNVPASALYGIFTARAAEHFQVSDRRFQHSFIVAFAKVKRAAAMANMKTGKLDQPRGRGIVKACDEIIAGKHADQFILDVFQAGAGTATNMNLNEVIANRALELLGKPKGSYPHLHPNDHVNMSQSTNDTFHTTMHVAALHEIRKTLLPELVLLERSFAKKAMKFKNLTKSGRTHLQHAAPITLGQEFSGYADIMRKCRRHIEDTAKSLLELPLGGTAVGTGLNAGRRYKSAALQELKHQTKLPFRAATNPFAAQQNMPAIVQTSAALKSLAIELIKISMDLRLLASSDIHEINLPALQPGSSIMPGKVNPSVPEMMTMVCFQVIGNDGTISLAGESGNLELNVMMPIAAYDLVESISILANAVRIVRTACIDGVTPDSTHLEGNLAKNPIVATALNEKLGYEKVSAIVKDAAHRDVYIKSVLLKTGMFSKKEIDQLLDPRRLTKEPK